MVDHVGSVAMLHGYLRGPVLAGLDRRCCGVESFLEDTFLGISMRVFQEIPWGTAGSSALKEV